MTRVTYFHMLLLLLCAPFLTRAQQVGEEDVNLQKIFIDASREKVLGNYQEAAVLFEQVLDEEKTNHAAAFELGRVYDAMDDTPKAVKYLKMAADLDPANEWYLRFLADLYQKTNQNEEAAELYENLVSRQPQNEHYYFRWAYFLVRDNQIDQAIRVYDQLEKRIGVNEEVIRRKHTLYIGAGDNKRAARELERLVAAFPNNTEYQHLLATFYQQTGQEKEAREIYRQILQISPDDAKATIALAGSSQQANDEVQYLRSLQPVFSNPEVDIDLKIRQLFPFINKVADTGDRMLADAALELTSLLELAHPGEAKAFSAAGDLLYHSGRPMEALEKYQKTLALDETVFLVWEQLLFIYHDAGDYDQLASTAENAMDLFPNKALVYFMNGVAHHQLGDHRKALRQLDQALLMVGNDARLKLDIYHRRGMTYYDQEQYNASFDDFEKALQINPEAPEVLIDYSYRLASQNFNLEKAREMAALANDLITQNAVYQDTYGWVLYKLKDYKKARKWLEQALGTDPDHPRILEHFGDLLFQLGEVEPAIDHWKKAQQKGNESQLLERKINDRQLYEQ